MNKSERLARAHLCPHPPFRAADREVLEFFGVGNPPVFPEGLADSCVLLVFLFLSSLNVEKISTPFLRNHPAMLTPGSFATAARIDSISCAE